MSSIWVNALLAATALASGVIFLLAAARRPAERLGCLAHALMGVGMAGMFSPWGDPVPAAGGALVFGLIAAWFAAAALRTGRLGMTESVHLVVGPAAMVLMYLTMGSVHGRSMHAGSMPAAAAPGQTGGSPLLSAVALALIGYFVWYAWILAARLPRPQGPSVDGVAVDGVAVAVRARVTTTQVVVGAHVVMCVLMALMFLGTV